MRDEKELMKYDMVSKIAVLLMEDGRAKNMSEALDTVINSETYQKLMKDETALYYQSARYVYTFLINELTLGKSK